VTPLALSSTAVRGAGTGGSELDSGEDSRAVAGSCSPGTRRGSGAPKDVAGIGMAPPGGIGRVAGAGTYSRTGDAGLTGTGGHAPGG